MSGATACKSRKVWAQRVDAPKTTSHGAAAGERKRAATGERRIAHQERMDGAPKGRGNETLQMSRER